MWEKVQTTKMARTGLKGSLACRRWSQMSTLPYRKLAELQKRLRVRLVVRRLVRPRLKIRHLRRSRILPIYPHRNQAEVDQQGSGLPASR